MGHEAERSIKAPDIPDSKFLESRTEPFDEHPGDREPMAGSFGRDLCRRKRQFLRRSQRGCFQKNDGRSRHASGKVLLDCPGAADAGVVLGKVGEQAVPQIVMPIDSQDCKGEHQSDRCHKDGAGAGNQHPRHRSPQPVEQPLLVQRFNEPGRGNPAGFLRDMLFPDIGPECPAGQNPQQCGRKSQRTKQHDEHAE